MSQKIKIIGSSVLIAVSVAFLLYWLTGSSVRPQRSREELRNIALDLGAENASGASNPGAAGAEQRQEAAIELLGHAEAQREDFRQLADRSNDPVVRGAAFSGMGKTDDWDSVPVLIDALSDPDPYVRGQAGAALKKILRIDLGFKANDPPQQREAAIQEIKRRYDRVQQVYQGERSRF